MDIQRHSVPTESALQHETPRDRMHRGSANAVINALDCKVQIVLEGHTVVNADEIRVSTHELHFSKAGVVVFSHVFKHPIDRYCPWRDGYEHRPLTISYVDYDMKGCKLICADSRHAAHADVAPDYIFEDESSYRLFQTVTRGFDFIREFEMLSVKTKGTEPTQSDADQVIKIWRSAQRTILTIPLTVPSSAHKYKIKHIELCLSWLTVESSGTKSIKIDSRKDRRKSSLTGYSFADKPSRQASRLSESSASSWKLTLARVSTFPRSSPQINDEQPSDVAMVPADLARRYLGIVLEFKSGEARDASLAILTSHNSSPSAVSRRTMSSISSSLSAFRLTSPAMSPSSLQPSASTPDRLVSEQSPGAVTRVSPMKTHDLSNIVLPEPLIHASARTGSLSALSPSPHKKLCHAQEFRVLRIESAWDHHKLKCSLEHHMLTQPPTYDAMSYCWGTGAASCQIQGGSLEGYKVSEHLWRALCRLRLRNDDRLIWVDALCINQTDLDEKNQQIQLMRQIYSSAFRTVLWIGDPQPTEETCPRGFSDEDDRKLTLCVQQDLAETEHEDAIRKMKSHLATLKHRSDADGRADVWWMRLWCVQEFHFSQRSPSVYIDPHAMQWKHFCKLMNTSDGALTPFHGLRSDAPKSLYQLLVLTGHFRCADTRDRVYALVGMVSRAAATIIPDYRKSTISVLENACMYLIEEMATLDVLLDQRVSRSRAPEGIIGAFPSWLPDLTLLQEVHITRGPHFYNAGLVSDARPQMPMVRLTENSHPQVHDGSQLDIPRILHCRAIYFDSIVRRTAESDIPAYEQSPDESLIYYSLKERGHVIDRILEALDLDVNPAIGRLMLDYLLEGRRSIVDELERRSELPERDIVTTMQRQERDDLEYLRYESETRDVSRDVAYVMERWRVKISRARAEEMFVPERLKSALASGKDNIKDDFLVARDSGNLFAYARRSQQRYYFTVNNTDAPMRRDVLQCKNVAEVKRLRSQYDSQAKDLEFHEYSAKNRERDFFKTSAGFLGLGPSSLQLGDKIVVPLGASRPFILRQTFGWGDSHILVGEAVVPSIMSGKYARLELESAQDYKIR